MLMWNVLDQPSSQTPLQMLTKLILPLITEDILHNHVLIFGDFNSDILNHNQTWLREMSNLGLQVITISEPSTDNSTQSEFHSKFSSVDYES